MSTRILRAATVSAALIAVATPAWAGGNPHFIGNATDANLSGNNLVVNFKEAGLASGSTQTITASAHLEATFKCINGGGHNPSDPKKTSITDDFTTSGEFTAGKNGQLRGSLTLMAPTAAQALDCPKGQRATTVSIQWSQVSVTDSTSGAHYAIGGSFTAR